MDVLWEIPFWLHIVVNSCLNSGPWSVMILLGFGYRANHVFSTAAAPSLAVVDSVCLISTRLVHASIMVIAWKDSSRALSSIFQGPIESQWTSCHGATEASLGAASPYVRPPLRALAHSVHC